MKQLLQNMKNGKTEIKEIPLPAPSKGMALVQTANSLVSAGTERTLVEFAEKNLVEKAASRPDLVRQVMNKAKNEGILSAASAAFNRLDQPMFPGYSSAGTIVALGADMEGFKVGDRVACGGANHAVHAEYGCVPKNLMVKIPDNVSFEEAAFATLGSVAMHGFRLAAPQLNERVLIIGLGLLGQMAIQIAKAAGCQVFGVDISAPKIEMARGFGAEAALREDAEAQAATFTKNAGFDHVLICAGSHNNDSIELAGKLCRDRGNVVAIGAVGLEIPRKIYYEKELNLTISRSYGPGRYDNNYEEKGQDYPIGFVRWTECRNMESFIDLVSSGKMDVKSLISHRIPIEEGEKAYELITGKTGEAFLGVLLSYPEQELIPQQSAVVVYPTINTPPSSKIVLGVLGAGNYANATFLPVIRNHCENVRLFGIASGNGGSARHSAEKFGFEQALASGKALLDDPDINTIVLMTPHHLHADQICQALKNEKNIYCEKPTALSLRSLANVIQAVEQHPNPVFTMGYNRRFAPLSRQLSDFLAGHSEPLAMHYTVNAGFIPSTHWTQDNERGGGRIIGEACHFIDYLTFLCGALPISVSTIALPDNGRYNMDNVSIQLRFADGSIGTVSYLANGDKSYPKERIEVFSGGSIAVLDNFRQLDTWKNGSHKQEKSALKQDKGHAASWQAFIDAVSGKAARPIPLEQIFSSAIASIASVESIQQNDAIAIPSAAELCAIFNGNND